MITIKDFMEATGYRIIEGSEYQWSCYGDNAFSLDSWNGDNIEGYSAGIVFDTKTQVVYEATVYDYKNNRAYRLHHLDFKTAHYEEAIRRNIDPNEAIEELDFVDLEDDNDFLKKLCSIINNEKYDTRVTIPIDFPDDKLLRFMIAAHEKDMTFNAFVNMGLTNMIEYYKEKKIS